MGIAGFGGATGRALGKTNYLGCAGGLGNVNPTNAWARYKGVFGNRTDYNFGAMTDGSSNVFAFGEVTGSLSSKQRTWVHGWLGCGIMPTAWGLPVKRDDQRWYRFGSDHPRKFSSAWVTVLSRSSVLKTERVPDVGASTSRSPQCKMTTLLA